MNSAGRPNFEVIFHKKVLAGLVNNTWDSLKNVRTAKKCFFNTIQTYAKRIVNFFCDSRKADRIDSIND